VGAHRTKAAMAGTSRRTVHTVLVTAPLPCVTPAVAPCVAAAFVASVAVLGVCVAPAVVGPCVAVVAADTRSLANRPTNRSVSASVNFIVSF